jgi:hypothetical protein
MAARVQPPGLAVAVAWWSEGSAIGKWTRLDFFIITRILSHPHPDSFSLNNWTNVVSLAGWEVFVRISIWCCLVILPINITVSPIQQPSSAQLHTWYHTCCTVSVSHAIALLIMLPPGTCTDTGTAAGCWLLQNCRPRTMMCNSKPLKITTLFLDYHFVSVSWAVPCRETVCSRSWTRKPW